MNYLSEQMQSLDFTFWELFCLITIKLLLNLQHSKDSHSVRARGGIFTGISHRV